MPGTSPHAYLRVLIADERGEVDQQVQRLGGRSTPLLMIYRQRLITLALAEALVNADEVRA